MSTAVLYLLHMNALDVSSKTGLKNNLILNSFEDEYSYSYPHHRIVDADKHNYMLSQKFCSYQDIHLKTNSLITTIYQKQSNDNDRT